MKTTVFAAITLALAALFMSGCETKVMSDDHNGEAHEGEHSESEHMSHRIVVTNPIRKDVVTTQQYVCQIHSCRHIEVRAIEGGYLEEICVNEGQAVRKGDLMFKILPVFLQARLASEEAEAKRISIELQNAKALLQKDVLSPQAIALKEAELAKAEAQVQLARAELSFTNVVAPFDGIVDRQMNQLGSLIEEGDILTTLSDNSLMWVYFNVPERRYLEYKEELEQEKLNEGSKHLRIELRLANGNIFPQKGTIGAIEADFDNTTGNIAFRADFPNPKGLLRNGQTGTILIHTDLHDALVIPQRAKYEILAKQYVFVVDDENVVHQRDITVEAVLEDIFVIKSGLEVGDKIVLEGIREVRDGDKIEYDYEAPEDVLSNLKYHAE